MAAFDDVRSRLFMSVAFLIVWYIRLAILKKICYTES